MRSKIIFLPLEDFISLIKIKISIVKVLFPVLSCLAAWMGTDHILKRRTMSEILNCIILGMINPIDWFIVNKLFSEFSVTCAQSIADTDKSNIFNYLDPIVVQFTISRLDLKIHKQIMCLETYELGSLSLFIWNTDPSILNFLQIEA